MIEDLQVAWNGECLAKWPDFNTVEVLGEIREIQPGETSIKLVSITLNT